MPSHFDDQEAPRTLSPSPDPPVEDSGRYPALLPPTELGELFALLRRQFGIDFSLYKEATVARRLHRRMGLCQCSALLDYLRRLESDPGEVELLYGDLLVDVTQFFRDPEAFALMQREVIPRLLQDVHHEGVRVWVAGCATGEEAYSIAMLLHHEAERMRRPTELKVFATDAHRGSLVTAAAGIYPESSLAHVPPELRQRYFALRDDRYLICPRLRQSVIFTPHNVIDDPPFTRLDLITCRNVLIYLRSAAQAKAIRHFRFGLREGGILWLGANECLGNEGKEGFESIDNRWRIYRRPLHSSPRSCLPEQPESAEEPAPPTPASLTEAYELLVGEFVPAGLLLGPAGELLQVFGDGCKFLSVPEGRTDHDVFRMLDGPLRLAVNSAIRHARDRGRSAELAAVPVILNGEPTRIRVSAVPLGIDRDEHCPFFVGLQEETELIAAAPAELFDLESEAADQIRALESELRRAKEHLRSTVAELEARNEQLRAANEELQSANEELSTVNSEYQHKIEELTQLSADMDNLLANTDIGTIFLDATKRVRKYTPAIAGLFHLLPQDVGRPLSHIAVNLEIDHPTLAELIDRVHRENRPWEREVEGPGGRWFLMRILPYLTLTGTVGGTVLTFTDVTAGQRVQHQLESNERRLRLTLQAGSICTWEWEVALDRFHGDECFNECFALDRHEIVRDRTGFEALVHPEDRLEFRLAFQRCLQGEGGFDVDFRIPAPGGEPRYLTCRAELRRGHAGEPERISGVCIDVTQRKLTEEELRESRQRLRAILDNATAAIYVKDLEGRYLLVNRETARVLGSRRKEILGQTDYDVLPYDIAELLRRNDRQVVETGKVLQTEEAVLSEGEMRTFLSVKVPLRDVEGEVYAVAGISTDITDRKLAEQALQDAITRRDQFLAMLSHELRNPLGAVVNAAMLLEREPTQRQALEVINRQAGLMKRLLDDLLDVTRVMRNKIQLRRVRLDFTALARDVAEGVAPTLRREGIDFTWKLPAEPLFLEGDPDRLQQVVTNLLTNAQKYTPAGGRVRLSLKTEGTHAILIVRDTGCGVADDMREKIFELFFQADQTLERSGGGLGVGLTLVRTITELHGGSVCVRSDGPGSGSRFMVRLPLAVAGEEIEDSAPEILLASERTIVLVEDNEDSRWILTSLLHIAGFDVRSAEDGEKGLELILNVQPRLAVVDIGLPGIDGYQIARQVRTRFGPDEVYLVALTGYGLPEDRQRILEAGFDEHLVKPLRSDDLERVLNQRLVKR